MSLVLQRNNVSIQVLPAHALVSSKIDDVIDIDGPISAPDFAAKMESRGVNAIPSLTAAGELNGFSYEVFGSDAKPFPGSHLGDAYKWSVIASRGVEYVKDRDLDQLQKLRLAAIDRGSINPPKPKTSIQRTPSPSSLKISVRDNLIAADIILRAKQEDPTNYLASRGFEVKRARNHLSARVDGKEVYRLTLKDNGAWVACDLLGNGIGDNIKLVQTIDGVDFGGAVESLTGIATRSSSSLSRPVLSPVRVPPAPQPQREPPTMPAQSQDDIENGRQYLRSRGISTSTIEFAESSGMLRYSQKGVLFVGRDDDGVAQNITRRSIDPSEAIQKRDLFGSEKCYPQILPGAEDTILIVEGGVDALAAVDISARSNKPTPPTIIVSGGAGVRNWIDTPSIQSRLRKARQVIVVGEREKNPETQVHTDAAHQLQADKIRALGVTVKVWTPQAKDLAELNFIEQQTAKKTLVKTMTCASYR